MILSSASAFIFVKVKILSSGKRFIIIYLYVFQDPNARVHHEPELALTGCECEFASDYIKRPNVFRLRLASGAEYLFMAKDQVGSVL